MKNNMLGIFATPIYFAILENIKEVKEEFDQIKKIYKLIQTKIKINKLKTI